ncbi:MAG: sigma-54-dependent Fis family transcriptional regulator, partial [Candidatus Marinimicrobia bacterium]|nr:sigma-54-dependent Fis family transcriptional regulator [Candidatus Neomarinimicrobiota bacterium]
MKSGAWDFLTKPVDLDQLETLLKGIENHIQAVQNPQNISIEQDSGEMGFLARDPVMLSLLQQAKRVADSQATVLITGETGVGKEVLAEYLHQHSNRRKKPMVAVNCAALPSHLIESELFGHEKGAFTGAQARKIGKFELAHNGTILLDEISEMDIALQAKLLRVLQEREVDRVGGR